MHVSIPFPITRVVETTSLRLNEGNILGKTFNRKFHSHNYYLCSYSFSSASFHVDNEVKNLQLIEVKDPEAMYREQ